MEVNTKRNDLLDRDALRADEVCGEVLQEMLRENQDTEYGKTYGFSDIKNYADYKEKVPLIHYEDVAEQVERMYAGEENVLTAYPVKHFYMTSGTTGSRKRIPGTYKALKQYNNTTDRINEEVAGLYGGKRLCIPIYRTDVDGEPEKDIFLTAAYARNIYELGFLDLDSFVGGKAMYFNTEPVEDFIYAKLFAALLSPDIISIESTFLYDQLLMFHYLEKNWRDILNDIQKKSIPESLVIPEDMRSVLLSLPVSEKRLADIREECEKGFTGIGRRLWKSLKVSLGISSKGFESEEKNLRAYLGEVPLYFYSYACSECNIGVPMALESYEYVLLPRCGFFEFIPYGERDTEPKPATELTVGKEYELVITNWSGLYRYRTNDIIKITDYYGTLPVLRFLFRRDQLINIAGEKADTAMLQTAVSELEKELSVPLERFCFAADYETLPGRYLCFIEVREEGLGDRADAGPDSKEAGKALDEILAGLNPDYEDLRYNLKQIGEPEVIFIKRDSITELQKRLGKLEGQRKPLRIIEGESIQFLRGRKL